ncbi:MAG TPA: hypothetical protein VKT31_12130 [Solirubrobacteraceae bacterium]|nr:hypothetical protein [Solirubrobacteraceae bacterium]
MARLRRLLPLAALLLVPALHAAPAAASTRQVAIFQDDGLIKSSALYSTLPTLRSLGVTTLRVTMQWDSTLTRHASLANTGKNPNGSGYDWAMYDAIDRAAAANGIQVYFMLDGPAPSWGSARGPAGFPGVFRPNAREFGYFVYAAGKRYSGGFAPPGQAKLPGVHFWSIWNEANYGYDLAPQTVSHDSIETGAAIYRSLVDNAWSSLMATGHTTRHDTILIGELAPRGLDHPIGTFGGVKPLRFLRALYCVDSSYRVLRGFAASARGCPTTRASVRSFRRDHPGLFGATGFAAHLYSSQAHPGPPTQNLFDPDYADLPNVGRLEATLDRLNRVWGSRTRFPIWNTEYAYRTRPPDPHAGVSLSAQAYYLNWAEYLTWRQPRISSFAQYLLRDPANGLFASGLEFPGGGLKPSYYAWRMPLYLPSTSTRRGWRLEVWGDLRPAHFQAGPQSVLVEFRGSHGGWSTKAKVTVSSRSMGYFDLRVRFPSSGSVRLAWKDPAAGWDFSRTVGISLH